MAENETVGRDAATDAFWAGRWAGMASALAFMLRDYGESAGSSMALAEYDRLARQFESPAYLVADELSREKAREWMGSHRPGLSD